jgi:hypothetical protein
MRRIDKKRTRKAMTAPVPEEDPEWLRGGPEGTAPAPPVHARANALPFLGQEWKDFERLCRHLAERDFDLPKRN